MAKAKTTPKKETPTKDDGTITRESAKTPPAPPTPKASDVEKTESFTAPFKNDAHAAADYFVSGKDEVKEEISREESSTNDGDVKVTVTYK